MCSQIVERRKIDSPGIDTTQILNQLLADDVWLETVSRSFLRLLSLKEISTIREIKQINKLYTLCVY